MTWFCCWVFVGCVVNAIDLIRNWRSVESMTVDFGGWFAISLAISVLLWPQVISEWIDECRH